LLIAAQALATRIAPLPKPDPNENPDIIEYGKQARDRFHKLIDQWVATSESWPKCTACGQRIKPKEASE
jgi:hypothetical protein